MSQNQLDIVIAATFTAEPIREPLSQFLTPLSGAVEFAPYNQVFQELLDTNSAMGSNIGGVNILLIRPGDWFRFQEAPPAETDITATVDEFLSVLEDALSRRHAQYLLVLSPDAAGYASATAQIQEAAAHLSGLRILRIEELDATYDSYRDELGHIPYTRAFFAHLALLVSRQIYSMVQSPKKVVALDCDNTLWTGVVGEDGPEGVVPNMVVQQFMVEQQQQGKLLCLCSKNIEEDVWRVFDAHPDMPLRREHIVGHRINWQPKSDNLAELADELNLGIDSFIFVDDNPVECAEVGLRLPEVFAVQIPKEPQKHGAFFSHHWVFDQAKVTAEDRKRTAMYLQERARKDCQTGSGSFDDFLKQLQLEIDIAPLSPEELPRASQLTQRTNQFNATTIRRTEEEIQGADRSGTSCAARDGTRSLWQLWCRRADDRSQAG